MRFARRVVKVYMLRTTLLTLSLRAVSSAAPTRAHMRSGMFAVFRRVFSRLAPGTKTSFLRVCLTHGLGRAWPTRKGPMTNICLTHRFAIRASLMSDAPSGKTASRASCVFWIRMAWTSLLAYERSSRLAMARSQLCIYTKDMKTRWKNRDKVLYIVFRISRLLGLTSP